ncbi:hypothetical protein LTR95_009347 [Oleoguttula sp. CCFEE 5521]
MDTLTLDKVFERRPRAQTAKLSTIAPNRDSSPILPVPPPAAPPRVIIAPRRSRILDAKFTPSWVPAALPRGRQDQATTRLICLKDWRGFSKQITLFQGVVEYKIGLERNIKRLGQNRQGVVLQAQHDPLFMFKKVRFGIYSRDALELYHEHLHAAFYEFPGPESHHVGFQYAQHALDDVLLAGCAFQEAEIHCVAKSVSDL